MIPDNIPPAYLDAINRMEASLLDISPYVVFNMGSNNVACHLYLYNQKSLTLTIGAKVSHITFNDADLSFSPESLSTSVSYTGSDKLARVYIDMMFNWDAFADALRQLAKKKRFSVTVDSFGCCNDFYRCSDARACIHQGDYFHLGCEYRRNLENGKIFYGKNRNVD